mmetsp:Transcript_16767/g.27299  ORF Transcript_16767/g.27299 Transcript_16767/m.27299 type:complete len:108 (+) Transcript_16767:81-404(+)
MTLFHRFFLGRLSIHRLTMKSWKFSLGSLSKYPGGFQYRGEIINKTSFDEGEIMHMCHGIEEIFTTHQARSRGTAAQSREIDRLNRVRLKPKLPRWILIPGGDQQTI